MSLSDDFHRLLNGHEDEPGMHKIIAEMVLKAPVTPESNGLLALMYHEGIGVSVDLDKSCELAEKAAFEGNDGLGYFLLGYMCDNAETPDQKEGGPRQKYDHYDAERFYEKCTEIDSRWAEHAHLWLGDYFMNSAQGGDPDVAIEHYEAIGENNAEAAGRLSDYYWEQQVVDAVIPEEYRDKELEEKIFKWTHDAVRLNPHDYSYRMGWCYADGIGCDAGKGFRLARKYWEDAYEFGDWRAADSIATLFEERLENLPDDADHAWERQRCEREITSWRKLAAKTREREWAKEPDPSIEED